jgi:hypothetical protein
MRATLLVRSRKEKIATVTTNIRQYYTTDPQTDGINIPSVCGSVMQYCLMFVVTDDILSSLDLTSSFAPS